VGVYRSLQQRDGGEIPKRQDGQALRSKSADEVHGGGPSSHGVAGLFSLRTMRTGNETLHGHTPMQWDGLLMLLLTMSHLPLGVRADVDVSSSRPHSPSFSHHAGKNGV